MANCAPPQLMDTINDSQLYDSERVGLDELASKLLDVDIIKLTEILSMGENCYKTATKLANGLGVLIVLRELQNSQDKILEVFNCWREKPGSTVNVLVDVLLKDLNRKDCVDFINDIARYKLTKAYIFIHSKEGIQFPLQNCDKVPERRKLQDQVRPLIQEYLSTSAPLPNRMHYHHYRVLLKQLDPELTWDSTIGEYKAQQIDLYLSQCNQYQETEERSVSSPSATEQEGDRRRGRVIYTIYNRRNANTEYHNLTFGYFEQPPPPTPTRSVLRTQTLNRSQNSNHSQISNLRNAQSSISISLHSADQQTGVTEPLCVNTPPIQESGDQCDLANLSVRASALGINPAATPSSRSQPRSGQDGGSAATTMLPPDRMDPEWDTVSQLQGYHGYENVHERDLVARSKADVADHYNTHNQEGCYLIRPSFTEHKFALSFRHSGRHYDLNIVCDQDSMYLLKDMPMRRFQTVSSLIEYYKDNDFDTLPGVRLSVPI